MGGRTGPAAAGLVVILASVACNQPPAQPSVRIEPAAPTTLDPLQVVISGAEDPNANDVVSTSIRWTRDGEAQPGFDDAETVPITATTKGQVWRVVVTPTDGSAVGEAGEASVTVVNTLPTTSVSVEPAAPSTLAVVRTVVETSDADHDATSLRYEWAVNGSVTTTVAATLPATSTEKGQVWEVSVFASDDEGEGEPGVATFTIANSLPKLLSAAITPEDPDRTSTLACEASGWSDADGDDEGYQTEWLVDGTVVSTDDTLAGSELSRGDEVVCRLTPDDGDGTGAPVSSPVLLFGNTRPVLDSVTIGPEDPIASDTLTATLGTASDADGDDITFGYSWRVDGAEVATTETLAASRFTRDSAILLRVTPHDGFTAGAFVDSNVLIGGNNAPIVDRVELSPSPVFTSDRLEATVTATDRDGDKLTASYAWTVSGVLATTTTGILDGATEFDKGDTITVTVVADDGDLESDPATSATVTVQNSAPTAPELAWDVTEPDPADALQCVIDTASTDADASDSITYSFRWTIDGKTAAGASTTTYTGDTLPAGSWSEGDDVRCFVTAGDGTDSSDEVGLRLPIVPPCADPTIKTDTAGRVYVLCNNLETFADALAECRSMGGTWDLASVRSSTENGWLDKAVDGTLVNGAGNPFGWIGFTDEDVEGTWEWTDGSSVTFTGWTPPEPNGGTSQNCVMFRAGTTWKGTWNDIGCGNTNPYVCSEP